MPRLGAPALCLLLVEALVVPRRRRSGIRFRIPRPRLSRDLR